MTNLFPRKNINRPFFQKTSAKKGAAIVFPHLLRIGTFQLSVVLTGLVIVYATVLVGASNDDLIVKLANALGPICLFLVMCRVGYLTVRRVPVSIWTPYVAFIANCALFNGIGPLVYTFGSDDTLSSLSSSNLAITSTELLKTNLLTAAGTLATIFGFYLAGKLFRKHSLKAAPANTFPLATLAIGFTVAGFFIRYFLTIPYQFGMTDFTLPGSLGALQSLLVLGIALTGFLSVRSGGKWRIFFWVILIPNLFVAVLQFSKSEAIINLILPGLGCFMAHQNIRRLFKWVIVAAVLYFSMQPMVLAARSHIYQQTGTIYRATLPERFQIVKRYLKGDLDFRSARGPDYQPGWTRLNYSGQLAFAMRLYDQGLPSKSLQKIWIVFIPRVLWPSKPVGISPGEDFYEIVSGRRGSFQGLGIYGDGYWNAGWIGALSFGVFMGIIFGWMSQNTLKWLHKEQFVFLPVVLLAFQMALLGPNKFLINGLIGPSMIYIGYLLVISMIMKHKEAWEPNSKEIPKFL